MRDSRSSSLDARNLMRAASPTFSATTNASQMDISSVGAIITRKDLRNSMKAYDDLVTSCEVYREALMTMSKASSDFANAMHTCSRLKGATDEAGVNLQAAGGFHYLMGNHWDVLAHTLDQQFEQPLRQHLSEYKAAVIDRSTTYERTLLEKSKLIKQTEAENLQFGRKRRRDLQSFRQMLSVLQSQLDELDRLKAEHYQQVLEHEEEIWDVVTGKVCLVVRSSLDIFDRVTAKASDSILETMVQSIPDPFNSYGPPKKEGQLFSILTPLAMTPEAESSSDGRTPWTNELGVPFPRTEAVPTEWKVMGRTRHHSAPIASSSSNTSTSPLSPSPTPTRKHAFPTVLTVIDENRNGQQSEEAAHSASDSPTLSPSVQFHDDRKMDASIDFQPPPLPDKTTPAPSSELM